MPDSAALKRKAAHEMTWDLQEQLQNAGVEFRYEGEVRPGYFGRWRIKISQGEWSQWRDF